MKTEKKIARIISWWMEVEGKRTKSGKVYDEKDIELLEMRIKEYLEDPKGFDFDLPLMNWRRLGSSVFHFSDFDMKEMRMGY